jgi:hypothetical protein
MNDNDKRQCLFPRCEENAVDGPVCLFHTPSSNDICPCGKQLEPDARTVLGVPPMCVGICIQCAQNLRTLEQIAVAVNHAEVEFGKKLSSVVAERDRFALQLARIMVSTPAWRITRGLRNP